jgi:tRNA(fMet)-specific endonuclease VapC
MIEFLLDTNIISEAVKLQPNPVVLQRLQTSIGKIAIAAVTWHELLYGMRRLPESKRKQDLECYLTDVVASTINIIPYDKLAADWFATERSRLAAMGKTPSYADGQIASIAAVNDLVLVTRNVSDFADFNGIQLENWFN